MVLPRDGANTGTTSVHIYGRNFTSAICRKLKCKFGYIESPRAMYISNNHIICEAPDISALARKVGKEALKNHYPINTFRKIQAMSKALEIKTTVEIKVDFGDGKYIDTGKIFTYKHEPYFPTTSTFATYITTTYNTSNSPSISISFRLIICLIAVCFATSK